MARGAWPRRGVRTSLPVAVVRRKVAEDFSPAEIPGLALWLDASSADTLYTTDAGPVSVPGGWLPTSISGCRLWLDGDDASTFTAPGGVVSEWRDKSGASSPAASQATPGSRPTRNATAVNGRGAVEFQDTNALVFASSTASFNYLHNATGGTVFVVARPSATSNPDALRYLLNNANNSSSNTGISLSVDDRSASSRNNGVQVTVNRGVSGQATSSVYQDGLIAALDSYSIISLSLDNANGTASSRSLVRSNGTLAATTNTLSNTAATGNASLDMTIGNFGGGGSPAGVAEIIFYEGVLSAANRALVEAYLATKWGISGVHVPATATSDPVGYWADKSGNARHATQSTAASRPTISATKQNGRNALAFNGSSQSLSIASYNAENGLPGLTRYAVASMSSAGPTYLARVWNGGGDAIVSTVSGELRFFAGASAYSAVSSTNYGLLTSGTNIIGSVYDGTAGSVAAGIKPYYNGAAIPPSSTSGTLPTTLPSGTPGFWIGSNIGVNGFWTGRIIEYISYSRALGSADRQRLERYLSAKYGITLAPQVSNADAADWINRVYANGGTVSASTASAVNQFCNDIDAAGIRSSMYRANLFCGTGLNACLVPLYRGPSLSGTQYGNTTDTNVGPFVTGDYNETGAGGGLLGNGSSKYLSTGLTVSDIGTAASGHMSVYHGLSSGVNANRYYMGANDATTGNRFYFGTDSFSTATVFGSYGSAQNASQSLAANGHGPAGHRILSRETASLLTHYHNGSVVATNTTGIPTAVSNAAFAVFAVNRNGTVDRWHNSWIAAYSIGLGLNSSQAAAYRDAMQTFQTALGRNV